MDVNLHWLWLPQCAISVGALAVPTTTVLGLDAGPAVPLHGPLHGFVVCERETGLPVDLVAWQGDQSIMVKGHLIGPAGALLGRPKQSGELKHCLTVKVHTHSSRLYMQPQPDARSILLAKLKQGHSDTHVHTH
eukprot:562241-Pelagomonas_calceolata.AAC.4